MRLTRRHFDSRVRGELWPAASFSTEVGPRGALTALAGGPAHAFSLSIPLGSPPAARRALALTFATAIGWASAVGAEGIQVAVLDPDSQPAPGALVVAEAVAGESRVSGLTGDDGRAVIEGLPDGRYLVSAHSTDLSSAPSEVTLRDGVSDALELRLRFAAVRESVVVSTALGARREEQSGTFVDVLSSESLRERDEWFLLEGLRGAPGVLVYQTGSQGQQVALRFRGLPAQATLVAVDGVPLREPAAPQSDATALLASLSALGVDRVEIRRGGGSTIYGSNGMGGVLHIVTRSETAPDALRFSAGLGEYGHSAASAEGGAGGPRGGVFAGFSRLAVGEGADGDDPFTNHSAVARAGFRPTDSIRVTARSLFSVATVGLNESPFPLGPVVPGVTGADPVPEAAIHGFEAGTALEELDLGGGNFMPSINDPDNSQKTRFLSTLVAIRGSAGPDVAWNLRLHDLRTRRENEDGPGGINPFDPPSPQALIYEGRIRSGGARLEILRGSTRVVAGGEFEAERAATTDPGFETGLRQTSGAAFLQTETGTADGRAALRGAVRVQRFTTSLPDLTPVEGSPWRDTAPPPEAGAVTGEASGSFAIAPGFRLRASAGRGFRAPSLYERFGTWHSSFGYSVFGDPRLRPEYTTMADAGFSAESRDGRHEARGAVSSGRTRRPRSSPSARWISRPIPSGASPATKTARGESPAGWSWPTGRLSPAVSERICATRSRTPIRRQTLPANSNPTGSCHGIRGAPCSRGPSGSGSAGAPTSCLPRLSTPRSSTATPSPPGCSGSPGCVASMWRCRSRWPAE